LKAKGIFWREGRKCPPSAKVGLTLLDTSQSISVEEFACRLAEAPTEEIDAETIARVLAAEGEPGEIVSHEELRRRLSL
jgi:hypothetical protein